MLDPWTFVSCDGILEGITQKVGGHKNTKRKQMWRLGGHKHKLPTLGAVDKHLAMEFQCLQVITSQTKN